MNRRDFLLFRTDGPDRVVDLSCQKLFVHYLDLNSGFAQGIPESGMLENADWWAGEPPLAISTTAPEEFFRSVQKEILKADQLRIVDMEWMAQGDFRIRVETLIAAFRAAGGEIIYGATEESQAAL
ncbi:MAG: hypothetical protein EXR84_07470 [Gammaproteobacteria bacterium]|nr:hypothetical protein [Gammaproteobacteria bacterium]